MNRYFYINNEGKQRGSYTADELRQEGVSKSTLVWTQGMSEWKPAGELAELSFLFSDSAGYLPSQETVSMPKPPSQPATEPSRPIAEMPKPWLVESILVTILPFILCSSLFSLLGIIAIVHAAKVENLFLRGEYAASAEASKQAKRWTKITFWISIGWILVAILALVSMLIFGIGIASIGEVFSSSSVYSI